MPQGILPFQYKTDRASHQLTGLGSLPLYLEPPPPLTPPPAIM